MNKIPPGAASVEPRRWTGRRTFFLLLAATIFAGATWVRFSGPDLMLFNRDSWGYIGPALQHLSGAGFFQTEGREFFYPGFLRGLLGKAGSLEWVPLAQHALGLLSGVLWLLIWWHWMSGLPEGWVRRWFAPLLGLALVGLFLLTSRTVGFELQIRPESILPFFALAQIYFSGSMLRAGLRSSPLTRVLMASAASVFFGFVAVALRPSWGLALAGTPFAAFVLVRFARSRFRIFAVAVLGMCAGAGIWLGFSLGVQKSIGWVPDTAANAFLPKTLVSVHAEQIADYLESPEVYAGASAADRAFAEKLRAAVNLTYDQKPAGRLIRFDPDYIYYGTEILTGLPMTEAQSREYLMGLYWRSLLGRPGSYAAKWGRQLAYAYTPSESLIFRDHVSCRRDLQDSYDVLTNPAKTHPAKTMEYLVAHIAATRQALDRSPETFRTSPKVNRIFILMIRFGLLPALLVCMGGGMLALWRGGISLLPAAEAWIWSVFSLGAVSTVAIVHSFDVSRYVHILFFLQTLVLGAGSVLALQEVWLALSKAGRRWFERR